MNRTLFNLKRWTTPGRAGVALIALLLCTTPLRAAADDAATQFVEGEKLKVLITAVQGRAEYRISEPEGFKAVQVGQRFDEGVEFRTGRASSLQFLIEPQEVVRLDRLTSVTVLRANIENGIIKSDIGMTRGKLSAYVDVAARPHECRVITPNSVSAVTDTQRIITDEVGFAPSVGVLEGSIVASFNRQRAQRLGTPGQKNNVTIKEGRASAAATALEDRTVDPSIKFARSSGEEKLVQYVLNSGATVGFDRELNLPVVRGGSVPQADSDLIPILPGVLNFVLRWEGNSDLNFGVTVSPSGNTAGEFIYPVQGFNNSPTGGRIAFDHRGGPNGGYEVIYWPRDTFKEGSYSPVVVNQQGPATPATLDVFRGGQRLPINVIDSQTGAFNVVDTLRTTVQPYASRDEQAPIQAFVTVDRSNPNVTTQAFNRASRR